MRRQFLCWTGALALWMIAAPAALLSQAYPAEQPLGAAAQSRPDYLAHAGIEQRLGESLPLSAIYTDETGRTGELKSWFDGEPATSSSPQRPAVLAEVYYKCAMLCPQVLHGLATGLQQTTLAAGKDYQVLVFSIDPTDTPTAAAQQKRQFLSEAGFAGHPLSEAAVHFLTGPPASIAAMSLATGFHFVMVPGPDGKMDQFAHSSVIMFATPDGRLSKYLSGIEYPPRDLRLALLAASQKKISNPVDLLILYCCNYSPAVGRYSVSVLRILGIAGMVTVLIVIGMLVLLTRKPKGATA
jgi:protein SCO1/2